MRLIDILNDYKKMVEIYEEVPLIPAEKITEGGVYQLPGNEPLFLTVIKEEGDFADVAPTTFCWPLATKHDFLIEISHPFSDTWIVQTDLTTTVPKRVLEGAELIGKMSEEELKILKRAIEEKESLPKERRGMGYEDPVHQEFKKFEAERYKFLLNKLLSFIDEVEAEGSSEGPTVIPFPKSLVAELERQTALTPAASSERNVLLGQGVAAVLTSKGLEIALGESFKGKRGKVKAQTPQGEIPIYEGELPEVLIVRGVTPKAFRALSAIKVEVEA